MSIDMGRRIVQCLHWRVGVKLNKATSHSNLVTKLDLVPFTSPASKSLVKPLAVNALIEVHTVNFL